MVIARGDTRGADLVAILEATYARAPSDEAWLEGVARATRSALDGGLGVGAYIYDLRELPMRASTFVNVESPLSAEFVGAVVASATPDYVEKSWKTLSFGAASEVPGYDDEIALKAFFRPNGMEDMVAVNAYDPSEATGVWIGAPRKARHRVRKAERELWGRVSAHIANGYRLRRREAALEAILTTTGKTVHAEGAAKLDDAREALSEAVRGVERARGVMRERDPDAAVVSWRALVSARWSLVDHFESDGKRYLVARTNEPTPRGPTTLTDRERQIVSYAVLGHSAKLIAYELGIAPSTVRVLLARAARKLGAKTPDELRVAFEKA